MPITICAYNVKNIREKALTAANLDILARVVIKSSLTFILEGTQRNKTVVTALCQKIATEVTTLTDATFLWTSLPCGGDYGAGGSRFENMMLFYCADPGRTSLEPVIQPNIRCFTPAGYEQLVDLSDYRVPVEVDCIITGRRLKILSWHASSPTREPDGLWKGLVDHLKRGIPENGGSRRGVDVILGDFNFNEGDGAQKLADTGKTGVFRVIDGDPTTMHKDGTPTKNRYDRAYIFATDTLRAQIISDLEARSPRIRGTNLAVAPFVQMAQVSDHLPFQLSIDFNKRPLRAAQQIEPAAKRRNTRRLGGGEDGV